MLEIVIRFVATTGEVSVQCAAPAAVAGVVLDAAKEAVQRSAMEQLRKQLASPVQKPSPSQVKLLAPEG